MERTIKSQQGYLLIVVLILIIIVGTLGALLVHTFVGSTTSAANIAQSESALYAAASGIELVKRNIIAYKTNCDAVTTSTPVSLLGGQFMVAGTRAAANSTIASAIGTGQTSITLADTTNFTSPEGITWINDELISYNSISGNTLQNVNRGIAGTVAAAHGVGESVVQEQCLLNARAGMPTLAAATTKGLRLFRQILLGRWFSLDGYMPVIASVGPIDLKGTSTVYNPTVTLDSPNLMGSTLVSGDTVDIAGSSNTQVNSNGGHVVSSDAGTTNSDVVANMPGLTATTLWNNYFNDTKVNIETSAVSRTQADLEAGISGETAWVNGNISFTGGTINIGATAAPVILIVNGDFKLVGNAIVNMFGLLYVTGDINEGGGTTINCVGAMATEGSTKLFGTTFLELDPTMLALLSMTNPNTNITYNAKPPVFKEIFP